MAIQQENHESRRVMRENNMLSPEEAELQAEKGACELEAMIDQLNGESETDPARHADLTSHFMSLLAEQYGISAPPSKSERK